MKQIMLCVCAVTIASSLSVGSVNAAGIARENKRLQEGKITKNEAEHLVLQKFQGAKIVSCRLTRGKDHSVWVVDLTKAGTQEHAKVQVDGRSGKISP